MNWVDWTILAIFLTSIAGGASKGLVRESVGLAAAVLGIVFAARGYESAAPLFAGWIHPLEVANICGFLAILLAFLTAGAILGMIVSKVLRTAGMGWVDRLAGAGFGVVRAIVLVIGLILISMAFPRKPIPDAIVGSRLAPYFIEASYVLSSITPPEMKDAFSKNYEEVRRAWNEIWRNKFPRIPDSVI